MLVIVSHRKYINIFSKPKIAIALAYIMFLPLLCHHAAAQSATGKAYASYIATYKELAIKQQQEYGIPASITLAQGLLESNAGRSYLATQGNNHFGIKCHGTWKGESVEYNDTLQHDCYRKYGAAEDSYLDHAKFLKGKRYAPLYSLAITDYKGWAEGLKQCGYATDPAYPAKLIAIIEQYGLDRYDSGQPQLATRQPLDDSDNIAHELGEPESRETLLDVNSLHYTHRKWGLHHVLAQEGDSYVAIATEFGIKLNKLLDFNDAKDRQQQPLKPGSTVWLESKPKKAASGQESCVVQPGETLWDVSQRACIRLGNLAKLNKLKPDSPVQAGTTLRVR